MWVLVIVAAALVPGGVPGPGQYLERFHARWQDASTRGQPYLGIDFPENRMLEIYDASRLAGTPIRFPIGKGTGVDRKYCWYR